MKKIKVVGLGPSTVDFLSMKAHRVLNAAHTIFFRTQRHAVYEYLKETSKELYSFDDIYDQNKTFNEVYEAIADNLIEEMNDRSEVIYAIPGSPSMNDESIMYLRSKLKDKNIALEYIYSPSYADVALSSIPEILNEGYHVVNSLDFKFNRYNYGYNNLVIGIINQFIASEIKLILSRILGDEYEIYYIHSPGVEGQEIKKIRVSELDFQKKFDYLTSIFIPKTTKLKSFDNLLEIMAHLRSEDGCRWDRKQTAISLVPYIIEEAYEVVDAIESEDDELLQEELGDLLLQVIFQSQISYEMGSFSIYDVVDDISQKLIRRHPHVFMDYLALTSDEVKYKWEEIKKEEKEEEAIYQSMERLPNKMPALMAAYKIQNKAKNVGFDWETIAPVFDKIQEEIEELKEVIALENSEEIKNEFGDLLFTMTNLSRFLEVRPELCLREANKKFIHRFKLMEESEVVKARGFNDLSIEELENLWNDAKKKA